MIIVSRELSEVDSSDFEKIQNLDFDHFPFPWKLTNWNNAKENRNYLIFYDPNCFGFAMFLMSPLEKLGHLIKIVVSPDQRKMGIAASILNASLSQFRLMGIDRCILEVESSNSSAIALYAKLGYSIIHLNKKFYSNGVDALIMEKHL